MCYHASHIVGEQQSSTEVRERRQQDNKRHESSSAVTKHNSGRITGRPRTLKAGMSRSTRPATSDTNTTVSSGAAANIQCNRSHRFRPLSPAIKP